MNPLLIGVSSCFLYPDPQRIVHGPKTLAYFEQDMARYLYQPGVIPVLIPHLGSEGIKEILSLCHGIVFQGGTDMAPESYGESPIGKWKGDPHRDAYDLMLMDMAISANMPVFGICRGFQVMNVFFGGTLIQDIPTQISDAVPHRDAEAYDRLWHHLHLEPNSWLANLYPESSKASVNTVHHQGVKTLGKGLQILARSADDGLIEAFSAEAFSDHRVFGVQWHPEYRINANPSILSPDPILNHFLSCARHYQQQNK